MKGGERMRMTQKEMREAYPNQWLGLADLACPEGGSKFNFTSAEVLYTDKTEEELMERQVVKKEPIYTWYTGFGSAFPFVDICIDCAKIPWAIRCDQ